MKAVVGCVESLPCLPPYVMILTFLDKKRASVARGQIC